MRKIVLFIALLSMTIFSCTNSEKEVADNKIALRADTINVVKLTDTLVIYESTCRACQYETSINFAISDSMNIIKLLDVITTDNNSPEMNGGSISKTLVLVPLKTGVTTARLYKFLTMEKTAQDSARATSYKIEVK
jgi:hypothetical protein